MEGFLFFCENHEKRRKERKKSQGRKRHSPFSPLKSSPRSFLSFPSYRKSQPLSHHFHDGVAAEMPWCFFKKDRGDK
jgi:hypothetical protein